MTGSAGEIPLVPPHSLEAEMSVVGAVLLDERHLTVLMVDLGLRPEHFFSEPHRLIFAAILDLHQGGRQVDYLTVGEVLRASGRIDQVGGLAAVESLTGWVPAAANAADYGRVVRETAQLRDLLRRTYEIQDSIRSRKAPAAELVEQAERAVLAVAHDDRHKAISRIGEVLDTELEQLQLRSQQRSALTGVPSGFTKLDELTGGFQPGALVVLAARPGMGKSALVSNIAEHAVLHEHGVLMFSLEMSESELAQRFIASQGRIPGETLRRGRVPEHEWPRILEACARLDQAPLFLDDSGDIGVLEIRAKTRRLHQGPDGPLSLVIVDYLQLMRPEGRGENRVEQVGQMSRGLKTLARELSLPVIALSQLSRAVEQRADHRPIISDLRESGQIEADADLIMFIYRDELYERDSLRPGEADLIIAKHRSGPIGDIKLAFQQQFPKFMNYVSDEAAT